MKFDLHFHTTLSDGMKTSEEAVRIAKERGVGFLACTEHDIINKELPFFAKNAGIEAVEGVEISSSDYGNDAKAAHLTCYSRSFRGRIFDILAGVREVRQEKILLQIEKLQTSGFFIEGNDFFSHWERNGSSLENLNNGHIREYLFLDPRNKEVVKEKMGEAFNRDTFIRRALSKTGDFAHIGSIENLRPYEPSVELCGELARENKAILSIAHPNHTFSSIEEFEKLAPSYIERGVNALEIHISTPPEWIETILAIRKRFDLLLTFGSDCHFETSRKDGKHGMIGDVNPFLPEDFVEQEFRRFRASFYI